ncbi:MAG: SlyX family protein [Planctomycetota bacterium]
MTNDDDRLTVIEEKLAHLEKYVGDLDEVVRDLATRLAAQKDGVTAVRKLLEDHLNEPEGPSDLADEKPPHW